MLIICRAYHGHSKPLMGVSSYKMKQEKDGHSRIPVNPNAWIVSVIQPLLLIEAMGNVCTT